MAFRISPSPPMVKHDGRRNKKKTQQGEKQYAAEKKDTVLFSSVPKTTWSPL